MIIKWIFRETVQARNEGLALFLMKEKEIHMFRFEMFKRNRKIMKATDPLSFYYQNYDEERRLASRHGSVEFLTTMRYIEKYLTDGVKIVEIGAGTGRYSHTLARKGYAVDAVELVESNITKLKSKTQPGETITVRQGDARDLSFFADGTFDITLLLGPMYHLYTEDDAVKALHEALRVTKPGGVIFVAYCMSDPSIVGYGFQKDNIHSLLENGLLDPVTFATSSTPKELFQLYRKTDIDAFRAALPVTELHFVASDGFTNHMRETVDRMDDRTFDVYLRYHFAICEKPELVGWSHHTLDVLKKDE